MRGLLSLSLVLSLSACSFIDDYSGFTVGDAGDVLVDSSLDIGMDGPDAGPSIDAGPPRDAGPRPDAGPGCEVTCEPSHYCDGDVCVPDTILAIRSGSDQSCVVLASGRVRCWGSNSQGELGRGEGIAETGGIAPGFMRVEDVQDVAMGHRHSCALTRGGDVYCAGGNARDELGLGVATEPDTVGVPVRVGIGGFEVARIDAGRSTCVLTETDSRVWCWGPNDDGMAGQNARMGGVEVQSEPAPIAEQPFASVASIMVGGASCARGVDGSLECWGSPKFRVQPAGTNDTHTPIRVGTSLYRSIDVGYDSICGITMADGLECWGRNNDGEADPTSPSTDPVGIREVVLPGGAVPRSVSLGEHFACAIGETNPGRRDVYCWGTNESEQCGAPSGTNPAFPTLVADTGFVTEIAAGGAHVCALVPSGGDTSVRCWGSNDRDVLGVDAPGTSSMPLTIALY